MERSTRRRFVTAAGAGAVMLAGCLTDLRDAGPTGAEPGGDGPSNTSAGDGPPTADRSLPEEYTIEELNDSMRSGGPGKDGIPAIDDPQFTAADDPPSNLADGDPVFGVALNGEAKAYLQSIVVWHEIVNDVVGGESVAVTYCPLTGTAQGFYRGPVEFGVSGRLINTNLVMYDRGTDTWWPQMLARGITGPLTGEYLEEFQVVWTTWGHWRATHPETVVLTEETGYARDYARDPYGSYNPPKGYYAGDNTLFPPLTSDDRFDPKTVVIGARNGDGSLAVPKAALREQTIIEGQLDGTAYVTVHDPELDTGYVYRNPDERKVADARDGIEVDGEVFVPDSLPLDRQIAYDSMWMAWAGYYPSTVVHR